MSSPLGLDAWWDEPYYKAVKGSFSRKGAFILRKLLKHDGAKFVEVMADLYRDDAPDPMDITTFEWEVIRTCPQKLDRFEVEDFASWTCPQKLDRFEVEDFASCGPG